MKHHQLICLLALLTFGCKTTPDYMDDQKLCVILLEMNNQDQKYRSLMSEENDRKVSDSLFQIQKEMDVHNTQLLIEIVESRGWPNQDSLKCEDFGSPLVIFRHAPESYFNKIQILIDRELEEGRMGSLDHAFIEDHLNGRPGMPFEIIDE